MATFTATFSPLAQILPTNPTDWAINAQTSISVTILSAIVVAILFFRPGSDENVYDIGGIPIIATWTFFTKRYDFIREQFRKSGGKTFRFRILQHRVISLTGEQSRKLFFTEAGFDPLEGYKILMGGPPRLQDANVEGDAKDVQSEVEDGSIKRLASMLRRERLANALPILLDDINGLMKDWGTEGKINPFTEVYDVVFHTTIRVSTCKEFSEDHKSIQELAQLYWEFDQSATPVSLLLPWFPGPAKKAKERSTTGLYNLLSRFVELRRGSPIRSDDPIDCLIAEGHSNENIIGTIMGIIFAGIVNTGVTSCWILLYISSRLDWKQKIIDEMKALVMNHSDAPPGSEPLHKRLASIPLHAWENDLPALDLVIREAIRLTLSGSALRRNMKKDIAVDGMVIKRGDFLTYQVGEAHFDPKIYTNPEEFDPSRYLKGKEEDRKQTFAYLGWGVGRHPCPGMKLAKLELKLILAMIFLGFDFELVDEMGNYPKALPKPDRNDLAQARPLGDTCYLRFKRVAE